MTEARLCESRANLLPAFGKVAFYLRLSMADGDLGNGKDESNSIENQRALLQDYLLRQMQKEGDLEGLANRDDPAFSIEENPLLLDYFGSITEYVDDGYTGTNFNRPGFRRMIEDAKQSRINTVLVKDTSRLGRDYIEVGDYMEQIFPRLGIRLIAVNTGYDSDRYHGSTMGLETSMTNFIYAEYSRDLSRKVTSAKHTKWSQGIPTSGKAPFGYLVENKRYVIDPEAAEYVKLIFEKAVHGWTTSMIVNLMNDQHIPAPGVYRKQKTGWDTKVRRVFDEEWLWNTQMIHSIIRNYSYTGNMVHGKTKLLSPCSKVRKTVDKEEWYILKGSHEAIVSEEDWEEAQAAIKSVRKTYRLSYDHPLKGKVRCGNCGLVMNSRETRKTLSCQHAHAAGRASRCDRTPYSEEWVCSMVRYELNRQLELLDMLELRIEAGREERRRQGTGRKYAESQMELLKAEKVRQYEAYATGVISREAFVRKKDELDAHMKEYEDTLAKNDAVESEERGLLHEMYEVKRTMNWIREEDEENGRTLTRAMVQAFIKDVWIHSKERMEIEFTFDDLGRRAVDYLEKNGMRLSVESE